MRPATIFALAHLAGTLVGLPSGALLPWWLAGAPAWLLAGLVLWLRPLGPTGQQWERAFTDRGPSQVGWRVRLLNEQHAQRVASLAHGLFWGCLAGTATEDESTAPPSPMFTGLGLYLVVAGLCALPVVWEVL